MRFVNASSALIHWRNNHLFGLFDPKMLANSILRTIRCAFRIKNPRKSGHFSCELKPSWRFFISIFLIFSTSLWGKATVSAYAVNMRTKEVVLDLQSDTSLIPASCLKIVTTGAALHLLSSDSDFQTTLEIDGTIEEGILQGNVWIRGGGDPCLGADAWEAQIDTWALAIQEMGIQKIRGRIIGDASRWERPQVPPSWSWEDLGNYYGAGASALSFHENAYTIYFAPGKKEGDSATILRTSPTILQTIQNEVKTGSVGSGDRACIYGSEFSTVQAIRGTVPAGISEFSIKGSIPDAGALCEKLLSQALLNKGIQIKQMSLTSAKRSVIHITHSPKIREIIHLTNQRSMNLYAEHLLKKMGEEMHNDGSTASGIKAVLDFWQMQGIDMEGFNMVDGSGLSRKNFITTKHLTAMLAKMKQSPHFSLFFDSLTQVKEGIYAKSGSMSFIKGCVGYKGDIAFAILTNYFIDRQQMQQTIDQLLDEL